ncbi:PH domain-containing protein [Blastococcus sp. SYSU D00813]
MTDPGGTGRTPDHRPERWRKDAAKYLLPGELPPVVATRRHWAVLIVPTVKALPVLVLGGWLLVLDPDNRLTSTAGLLVAAAALVVLALRVGEWWMRHFIVTNRRVLLTSGIVVRTVALLPLRRITDLTWKETLLGQVLGYGTFRFESAGQQQALSEITFLPHADVLYRRVSQLLFGGEGMADGDDEGGAEPATARPRPRPATRTAPQPTGWPAGDPAGRQDTQPIPRPPQGT